LWGRLSEKRAKRIFPILRDWVAADDSHSSSSTNATDPDSGRCFFKSTTAELNPFRVAPFETELRTIRPHALKEGCAYLDFAYLTRDFGAIEYQSPLKNPQAEKISLFVDHVRANCLPSSLLERWAACAQLVRTPLLTSS
jgi:hypothetical protein